MGSDVREDAPLSVEMLNEVLEDLPHGDIAAPEKTLLSIGGRGYFEKPTSDLLAFFLSPGEAHGVGASVSAALIKAAGLPIAAQELCEGVTVAREVRTRAGNRIDLLLVGDTFVIAIENKIRHEIANPFDDYRTYVNEAYPDRRPFFLLLAPGVVVAPAPWRSLSYEVLTDHLAAAWPMGGGASGKWQCFFTDFVLHLRQECGVAERMDDDLFGRIETSIARLYRAERLRDGFLRELQSRCLEWLRDLLPEGEFSSRVEQWEDNPAVRFYSSRWPGQSNVTLYTGFRTDETYEVRVYIDDHDRTLRPKAELVFNGFASWKEAEERWLGFSHGQQAKRFSELRGAFEDCARRLDEVADHRGLLLQRWSEQLSVIRSRLPEGPTGGWWIHEGFDLGCEVKVGNSRIGIESSFVPEQEDPLARFRIFVSTWDLASWGRFSEAVLERFPSAVPEKKKQRMFVTIAEISGADQDVIVHELTKAWQGLIAAVEASRIPVGPVS